MDSRTINSLVARAVIRGLRVKGYSDDAVAEMLGVSRPRFERLAKGELGLTDRMRTAVEGQVQLTIGQIAASSGPDNTGFVQLMDTLAAGRTRPLGTPLTPRRTRPKAKSKPAASRPARRSA
ncbi:MAG TPA: hypothetical protein VK986_03635 [Tepidisphaeraceae bacterium]|nr:hypothetical protein [Tepidisphaeraceae bacterium]